MTTNDTYLAVFLGSKTSPSMKAWMGLPEAERRAEKHQHFTTFPGESVEVMPIRPLPGA
jgi:hypothetical protein